MVTMDFDLYDFVLNQMDDRNVCQAIYVVLVQIASNNDVVEKILISSNDK